MMRKENRKHMFRPEGKKNLVGGFKHFFPFHVWDVILPIDELIFFRGVGLNHQPETGPNPNQQRGPKNVRWCIYITCILHTYYIHYMCYIHDKKISKIQLELAAVTQLSSCRPPSAMGFLEEVPNVGHCCGKYRRSFGYDKWDVYGWWLLERKGKKKWKIRIGIFWWKSPLVLFTAGYGIDGS